MRNLLLVCSLLSLNLHQLVPCADSTQSRITDLGASWGVVVASFDNLEQELSLLGGLGEAVCEVEAGVDVSHLLHGLLLLYTLTEFNDVGVEPVVVAVGLQVLNVVEERLAVCQHNTFQTGHSPSTHLAEKSSH